MPIKNHNAAHMELYQFYASRWARLCFGDENAYNTQERAYRFLEEALELMQACGVGPSVVEALTKYVYGRPVGHREQEVGGTMVTLAILVDSCGLNLSTCATDELDRVYDKIDKIRAKNAAKMADPNCATSPLPGVAANDVPADVGREDAGRSI